MIYMDIINGSFELTGALLQLLSIKSILKHKSATGVHWAPVLFFTSWGIWNLAYYPSLEQWFSFAAGVMITITNSIWVVLIIKYRNHERQA